MPLSVLVKNYSGEVLARSVHRSLNQLCELARRQDLPLLGGVDPYDDTVFNRSQSTRLRAELDLLRHTAAPAEAEAAVEVAKLVEFVLTRPHRYLVFNGD